MARLAATPGRADAGDGADPHLRCELARRAGRRRQYEPLRNREGGRQRRAVERRARRSLAAPPARHLSESGLAQPGAAEILDRDRQHRDDPSDHRRPHVPADPRRSRPRNAPPHPLRVLRGLLFLLRSHIGDRRVDRAIGLAGQWVTAAEVELRIVRMPMRPQAARPVELEEIPLRHEFRPGLAPAHPIAVQPADYRIFCQPHAAADLRGRQTLLEEAIQQLDALWRPGHFHRFPPYTVDPPVHPHKIRYHACGTVASGIYILVKNYLDRGDRSEFLRNMPESTRSE